MNLIFLQKIRDKIKYKRQFFLYIASYLIIIIVIISITMVGYGVIRQITQDEINHSNTQVIHQIKSMYDEYFAQIEDNSYRILKSQSVQNILNTPHLSLERQIEWHRSTISYIGLNSTNSPVVGDVQLIFRNKDLCFDSRAKYSKDILYNIAYAHYFSSVEEWLGEIFISDLKGFKILKNDQGGRKLFYIYSYPSVSTPSPLIVITEINQSAMYTFLESAIFGDNSIINIYDTQTQTVISSSTNHTDSFDYPSAQLKDNTPVTIHDKKYIINSVTSDKLPLTYVHMVENSVYSQNMNVINLSLIISYSICLFIGGFLAYLFSKQNYKPVMRLVNKFSDEIHYDHKSSEYSYLEHSITNIIKDRTKYKTMFDDQKNRYRNAFLSELLLDKVNTEDMDAALKYYDIKLKHKNISIVIFNIMDTGLLADEDGSDRYDLAYFVIDNILSDLLLDAILHGCKIDNKYACILNYNFHSKEETYIVDQLKVLDDVLYKNFKVELVSAVSQVSDDHKMIPLLYKQASEIISYGFLLDGKHILVYDDILLNSGTYQYSANMEYRLTNILDLGDQGKAKSIIKNIVDINIGNKDINIYMLRVLFVELTATIMKKAMEIDKNQELDIINFCKLATNLTDISKKNDVLNHIYDFVDKLCEIGKKNQKTTEIVRCDNIKKYVEQNYDNPELSVSSIAYEFKLSLNYLSTYFKEQTSQGLADYIVEIRIEKTKELLTHTNETISSIAQKVGFYSSGVFIRVFKKAEDITPGKYRSANAD